MRREQTVKRNRMMIDDYCKGLSVREVAEKYNLSVVRTYVILRRFPEYEGAKRHVGKDMPQYVERNNKIREEYRAGTCVQELADDNGLSRSRIYLILCRQDGYKTHRQLGLCVSKPRKPRKLSEKDKAFVEEFNDNPFCVISTLAKKHEISRSHAYLLAKKYGQEDKTDEDNQLAEPEAE